MKSKKKFLKKCLHFLTVYNFWIENEKPETIIIYIYKHIYELIKEMKYIPHVDAFEDFHTTAKYVYLEYYSKLSKNDEWVKTVFPHPGSAMNKFSFKKFFIGVVGRLITHPKAYYGDPATWNIGYYIYLNESSVTFQTCQFILLENYSFFQIAEEHNQELMRNYLRIICKSLNKYSGQPYNEGIYMNRLKSEFLEEYDPSDKTIQHYIESWKKFYNKEFNPNILEACNNIYKGRNCYDPIIKPLYLCKAELEEELKNIYNKKASKNL